MVVLEPMGAFFDRRVVDYDEHMLRDIAGAEEFYPLTAAQLPAVPGARVLDLGCGTGLELQWYFAENPTAEVTGIDLAPGMLQCLKKKFLDRKLYLVQGSYFDVPLGENYDAAVSVESLHHFTKEEKAGLYAKLCKALKPGGFFILTDYFSQSREEEQFHRQELQRLKKEQGLDDGAFYHYDTPLTVQNEREALLEAGFQRVTVLKNWGATCTLKAEKGEENAEG